MIELTQERLHEVLDYDPATGIFTWKKKTNPRANRVPVGTVCSNLDRHGYVRIRIDSKSYWAARLVWLYVHGKWPPHDIDHINGIRNDNRLDNLREATRSENLGNMKTRRDGLKGASYNKNNKRWYSHISVNKRYLYLGCFRSELEAHTAYTVAAAELRGQFARIK